MRFAAYSMLLGAAAAATGAYLGSHGGFPVEPATVGGPTYTYMVRLVPCVCARGGCSSHRTALQYPQSVRDPEALNLDGSIYGA